MLEADAPAESNQIGKVLAGKYRLDAYLSRGGMGSVYRATHLMLEKPVALKVIKPELVGSSEFARRFQREARAATSLNHPNIVAVYDLGQAEDGTLYIAMELVDGPSLKDAIQKGGPMDPIRIVRLVRQVLGALALAHRHHIVHRDLKPQNIMLASDRDGNEIAKLVDFGIAKTFDDRTQLTSTGFAIGTPQYMAPEQASGSDVDGRSDLYSLGIILYEMLVAEVPFNDPSTPAILVKHLTEAPVRPSLRRTDIQVHRGLEDIAVRCLEEGSSQAVSERRGNGAGDGRCRVPRRQRRVGFRSGYAADGCAAPDDGVDAHCCAGGANAAGQRACALIRAGCTCCRGRAGSRAVPCSCRGRSSEAAGAGSAHAARRGCTATSTGGEERPQFGCAGCRRACDRRPRRHGLRADQIRRRIDAGVTIRVDARDLRAGILGAAVAVGDRRGHARIAACGQRRNAIDGIEADGLEARGTRGVDRTVVSHAAARGRDFAGPA